MLFFIGLLLMVIGGAGLWRYQERDNFLFLVSALIFCIGSYYVTSDFARALE
ncbi:hypothetical protein [Pseudomonas chlororaphis]|uniref:hypothetical protein n=1 Tax=Pseudomonas chlororaphis TaxID=587753 RepID=UPI002407B45C|nr:hypothetical protein [Pseudomonas chlororaphis]